MIQLWKLSIAKSFYFHLETFFLPFLLKGMRKILMNFPPNLMIYSTFKHSLTNLLQSDFHQQQFAQP